MPKDESVRTVQPVRSEADRARAILGQQSSFIDGFTNLSELASRVVVVPRGRVVSPAESINAIVNVACAAIDTAGSARGLAETDEDFSPLERQLADIVLATMAVSKAHRLRVAQCVAAKLASSVSL